MSNLRSEFVIDGKVVVLEAEFNGIRVFIESESDDTQNKLYFVKGEKVIQVLRVSADCGQNVGYIDSIEFSTE